MDTSRIAELRTARFTGVFYLLLAITGVLGFMVVGPMVFVPKDPAKTVSNLMTNPATARIRLILELAIIVAQSLAAVWFYKLLRPLDKWAASITGLWGTVNAIAIMVSAIAISVSIHVANSAQNIEAKVLALEILTSVISSAWVVGGMFFGLWLIPMGYVVIKSQRMPAWLGKVLIIGGVGYVIQTFLIAAGIKNLMVDLFVIPASVGEFWMIGYLLLFGIRPTTADSSEK